MKEELSLGHFWRRWPFPWRPAAAQEARTARQMAPGRRRELNQGAAKEEVEKEEAVPYAAGVWTDNVYTNESLGMTSRCRRDGSTARRRNWQR